MSTPTVRNRDQRVRLAIHWMRRSHSMFKQGQRTDDVISGERAYQRWRKRVQRATQLSDDTA